MARTDDYTDDGELFSLDVSIHGEISRLESKDALPPTPQSEGASKLLAAIANTTDFEEQLLQAVRRNKPLFPGTAASYCKTLAQSLRIEGYVIKEHGPGLENALKKKGRFLETLSHNYLTCSGTQVACEGEVIVEPRFKDEFEIAYPTDTYSEYLAILPSEFVGTPEKLTDVIHSISQALADAFVTKGMALPPWRREQAFLSKWGLDASTELGHRVDNAKDDHVLVQMKHVEKDRRGPNVGFQLQPKSLPRSRKSLEIPAIPSKANSAKKISLLARGLAALQQRSVHKRKPEVPAKSEKLKRTFSWDFSGLQPITTVRRAGKVT